MFNLGVVLEDLGGLVQRSRPTNPRSRKIQTWRTVTTTLRGCTSRSASRSMRFGTSASTAGWC
jgi:hypothetical protein